jgi:hypothetical protein
MRGSERLVVSRLRRAIAPAGLILGTPLALFGLAAPHAVGAPSTPTLTITPSAGGHPYTSGQSIRISVGPNSRFTPNYRIEVLECAAPKGVLPVDDTTCDGNSTQSGSVLVNADGSFEVPAYTLYQLPNAVLGEPANHLPVCDSTRECVLYIGQDQNDFNQPKVLSGTFTVGGSSSLASGGTPSPGPATVAPGASGSTAPGTSSGSSSAATAPQSAAVTLSPQTGSSSQGGGVLAYTGIAGIPWLVGIGVWMILAGAVGIRVTRRTIR